MDFSLHPGPDRITVAVSGKLQTPEDLDALDRKMAEAVKQPGQSLVLDLSQADYIGQQQDQLNGRLVARLAHWHFALRDQGREFYAVEPNPRTRQILANLGMNGVLNISANSV